VLSSKLGQEQSTVVDQVESSAEAGREPIGGTHAEPPLHVAPSARRADGELRHFDEIVTPHPLVAFLFRRRTLIVLVGIVAMVPWARPQGPMLAAGIMLNLVAEAFRIWAAGTIRKTEELTTVGPYAYVRHPLYVGSFLLAIGYALMSGRWGSFLFVVPLFCLVYGAAVTTEEAMLHKLFGQQYAEYCRHVPRFFPRITRGRRREPGRFDWRQVAANKEYVNLIWMVVLSGLYLFRLLSSP
jgi:protein-S-isoprenylcysteine O-methyltransferase Ste14